MKLIKPSVEIIPQINTYHGMLEHIEKAARVCYKSEDKIEYDDFGRSKTAEKFVDKILNTYKHQSVAEHGTIYLSGKKPFIDTILPIVLSPYTKEVYYNGAAYVTTNYRVLLDAMKDSKIFDIDEKLIYMLMRDPSEYHIKRTTVKFICSRACAQQLTRHRSASFSMVSQRYCNYSKDKFGNEITYIYTGEGIHPIQAELYKHAEHAYLEMIEKGYKPQQARMVLPNATMTELIMTAYDTDWKNIFDLRCSSHADDEIRLLCTELKEKMNL